MILGVDIRRCKATAVNCLTILLIIFLMIQANESGAQVIFLVAGQSNAVGQGNQDSSIIDTSGNTFEYSIIENKLNTLQDPAGENWKNFERARTGSFLPSFATTYSKHSRKKLVVVAAARGGSSCHEKAELGNMGTWSDSGRMKLFEDAVEKTKKAIALTHFRLGGIIWCQGERDANAINSKQLTGEEYYRSLTNLTTRFRKSFGSDIPFYIIQTGFYQNHEREGFDIVRKMQEKAAEYLPATFVIYKKAGDFEQLGWMKDEIHYSQQGLNDIGEKTAMNITKIERKIKSQ
jgi:hypothetical protein